MITISTLYSKQEHLSNPTFPFIRLPNIISETFRQLAKMVQGLPAIDWKKPENTVKLLAAVLALFPGAPDCKKLAAAFGEFILAISSLEH